MAIVGAHLTSGYDSDGGNTSTTASVTPTSNSLQLLTVGQLTSLSATPTEPTISGNSLTWVSVNTRLFVTAGTDRFRVTTFRALGASPSTGTITISFGGQNQAGVQWSLDEFSGVDTSGTNGSGAIVQSAVNSDETPNNNLTVTLAAFGSVSNATYGGFAAWSDQTYTEGTGFTKLVDQSQAAVFPGVLTEYRSDNDTSVNFSTSDNSENGGIAIEIKASGIASTTITSGNNAAGASSQNTASVTLTAGRLYLLSVTTRTASGDPNHATATSTGATWVEVNSNNYDNAGSQKRTTVLRTMVGSNQTGVIAIDFASQTQSDIVWTLDEFTGMDTTGTNGSGAVVQSVVNQDRAGATTLTATLAAFGSVANATWGVCSVGSGTSTTTAGTGFSKVSENATASNLRLMTQFRNDNDTTVNFTSGTSAELSVIAVEIKMAVVSNVNRFLGLLGVGV